MEPNQRSVTALSNMKLESYPPSEEELKLLVKMLEIPSPSHHEAELSSYLVSYMQGKGFQAYQDDVKNAIGILGSGDKSIILLGHIDTVPGHIPVRIEDGRLFGRGSVDAKGPMACFIAAASRCQNEISRSNKRIIVVGAVEEEAATSRGAREAIRSFKPPEFCIIGEPSSWSAVTLGYKGRLLLEYELEIPLKHTAAQGKLACEEAIDFWNAIKSWCHSFNQGKGVFENVDASIRSINSRNDGISELVNVTLGFRLPVDFPLDQFKEILGEFASSAHLEFSGEEVAIHAGKSNPLVKAFLQSIRARQGKPKFKVKTGTSDMNVVAPHWKCPLLAYGPGDSSLDHTPDEHIVVEEYGRAIGVLELVLCAI